MLWYYYVSYLCSCLNRTMSSVNNMITPRSIFCTDISSHFVNIQDVFLFLFSPWSVLSAGLRVCGSRVLHAVQIVKDKAVILILEGSEGEVNTRLFSVGRRKKKKRHSRMQSLCPGCQPRLLGIICILLEASCTWHQSHCSELMHEVVTHTYLNVAH